MKQLYKTIKYGVGTKDGYIISYPQDIMGQNTEDLIFDSKKKANEEKIKVQKWYSEEKLYVIRIETSYLRD